MTIFRVPVQRRFSDIDLLGHVNNVVFHDYLQEARVHVIRQVTAGTHIGFTHVIVRQEINHRRPLYLKAEPVTVEIWIPAIGAASYQFAYRILDDDGSLAADALSVMAYFNPETKSASRIPPDVRALLTEALEPDRALESNRAGVHA